MFLSSIIQFLLFTTIAYNALMGFSNIIKLRSKVIAYFHLTAAIVTLILSILHTRIRPEIIMESDTLQLLVLLIAASVLMVNIYCYIKTIKMDLEKYKDELEKFKEEFASKK